MKKTFLLSTLCIAAVFAMQSARAMETKIRAGVGTSSYALGGDYIKATSNYTPVNLGVTLATDGGMYVDLAVSGGTGTHDGWTSRGAPSESFSRSDVALIFGASKLNQNNGIAGTLYVGLKTGSTVLGAKNAGRVWTEETFNTTGVVFGGGASFPIASGRAGAVGVNLGVGAMSANWKDNRAVGSYDVNSDTAFGGSFGVNYTYPITSHLGVVVDLKGNSYSYNFGTAATPFTVNETISLAGVSAYFKF